MINNLDPLTMTDEDCYSAKTSLQVNWMEGQEEDFDDLREAIRNKKAGKNFAAGPSSSEEEEEEEVHVEPPLSQPGPRLNWACLTNNMEAAKEVLELHPDLIGYQDDDGYTGLHRACYSNHVELAKYLIREAHADIHALTADGWTPLHSACRWNSANCVELLLQEGSNVNQQTNGGQTPLHLAAFCGNSRATMEILCMQPNLDPSLKNCQSDRAVDIANRNGNCVPFFDLIQRSVTKMEQ